jgi:hypothetical protein
MKITVSYTGDDYMPYDLEYRIKKRFNSEGTHIEKNEVIDIFRYIIATWLGEHTVSATSPCDLCHAFRKGDCCISKRERCSTYTLYKNINGIPDGRTEF